MVVTYFFLSQQPSDDVINLALYSEKIKHFLLISFHLNNIHTSLSFHCNFSCELGSRTFGKFDKLAESVNVRDDVKLAYVNCEADSEFCDSNGIKGIYYYNTFQNNKRDKYETNAKV